MKRAGNNINRKFCGSRYPR